MLSVRFVRTKVVHRPVGQLRKMESGANRPGGLQRPLRGPQRLHHGQYLIYAYI